MPRANWGVDPEDVDQFDRTTLYKPYTGPIPVNGVYLWRIKNLKQVAPDKPGKLPQLRVGLELEPREEREGEDQYEGYYNTAFLYIGEKTQWRYVPFLDAIGVTGKEFTRGTITDEEGNVRKIGKWVNTKDQLILAELKDGEDANGDPRKEIGTFLAADEYEDDEEEETEFYDEDDE